MFADLLTRKWHIQHTNVKNFRFIVWIWKTFLNTMFTLKLYSNNEFSQNGGFFCHVVFVAKLRFIRLHDFFLLVYVYSINALFYWLKSLFCYWLIFYNRSLICQIHTKTKLAYWLVKYTQSNAKLALWLYKDTKTEKYFVIGHKKNICL